MPVIQAVSCSSVTFKRPTQGSLGPRNVARRLVPATIRPATVITRADIRTPATLQALQDATPTAWRALGHQATRVLGPGTLVGSHPFLSAAGGALGAMATMALIRKAYIRLPAEQQAQIRQAVNEAARALERVGPYAGSVMLVAASGILGQEGTVRWTEARHLSAALMLVGSWPPGLAGVEILGQKLNIPGLRDAWSGPARFVNAHQGDVGGALLGAAGVTSAGFASRLLAANNPWGWALMAGSAPAILGGLELVGREHDIHLLNECLTRPVTWSVEYVRRVVSKDVALHAVGAALATAGCWGMGTGWQQLGMSGSSPTDAVGAAQITAGALAAGLGAGIWAKGRKHVPSTNQVLTEYTDLMASAALSAWGTALGKFAAYNILAFGPAYLNTAAAATALGFVGVSGIAGFRQMLKRPSADGQGLKEVDPAMDERLSAAVDRVSALSGSVGSGAWAWLVGRGLLQSTHNSALLTALNAVPQLGASAVLGAVSVGMMGYALNNKALKRISNDVADNVRHGTERAGVFAVEHPAPTLGALGLLLLLAKQAM